MKNNNLSIKGLLRKKSESFISSILGIFFVIFILLALASAASATTYYVRTDGNNACNGFYNNSGSSGNCAFRTITYGLTKLVAGDTLRVQSGTYAENSLSVPSGTSSNWITVMGDNKPVIAPTTSGFYFISSLYIIIEGFKIQGGNIAFDSSGPSGKNVIIKDNDISGQSGSDVVGVIQIGVAETPVWENVTIDGNNIHDLNAASLPNGIQFDGKNSTIKNNIIRGASKCITNGGGDGNAGTKILNNTVENCARGIRVDYGGYNQEIAYNRVINSGGSGAGLDLYPWTQSYTPQPYQFWIHDNIMDNSGIGMYSNNNVIVENNTFFGLDSIITTPIIGGYNNNGNFIFKNNTFNKKGIILAANKGNITITNNVFYDWTNQVSDGYVGCAPVCYQVSGVTATSGMNITNNVFYNYAGAAISSGAAGTITPVNIKNNIFHTVGAAFSDPYNAYSNVIINYNLVYLNSSPAWSGKANSFTTYNDPLFADLASKDFHLKSQYGRWNGMSWVTDSVTSPAIDAGNPSSPYSLEPAPNGNRINLGSYGNTPEASKSSGSIPPYDFSISNSGSITVNQNNSGSNTISANLISGTTQPVTFSTLGLPSGATSSFSGGNSCSPACSKTLTVSTSTSTPTGTYSIIVSATNGTIVRTSSFSLIVNAPDTAPPAAIANLATSNPTSNSITLIWTAPGDDGNTGTALQYDIRYSTSPVTDANWASATQAIGEPTPAAAGTAQSFTVTGLSPSTTYYFTIKTADEVPNWAGISNSPQGITGAASSNVFYVRTDGSDSCNGQYNNSGTSGNCAWRTIQKAASTLIAGQTARVQSGIYNEQVTLTKSGTPTQAISIIGDGNPIIDGTNAETYGFYANGKSYINVSGFTIRNVDKGVYLTYSHHITFTYLDVYGTGSESIVFINAVNYSTIANSKLYDAGWNNIAMYGAQDAGLIGSDHNFVLNNLVYNCGHSCIDIHTNIKYTDIINNTVYPGTGAGTGGIYIHNNDIDGTRVINNTVYGGYWSIYFWGLNDTVGVVAEGNVLHDSTRGLNFDDVSDSIFRNNIIYSNGDGGIMSYFSSRNNTIESNTIYNNGGPGIWIDQNYANTIKNNIIVNNQGYGISAGSASKAIYNDVWGNTGSYTGGVSAGIGSILIDPLFANPAAADFHLKSQNGRWTQSGWVNDPVTSPGIDAGDPSSGYSLEPQPNGNRINMGAYGNTPVASKSSGTIPSFDFSLSNSGPISVEQGKSGSNTITANLVSGITQPITFSISGLPSGATNSFTSNSCNPTCSTTLTISTAVSTLTGTYPIIVSATNGTLTKTTNFNLIVILPVPFTTITLTSMNDTSIKSGEPDLIRSSMEWIDLGKLAGSTQGSYRGLLYFDLSSIPSSAIINSANLTLIWEGENRNQTTVINIFRPSSVWDSSATWNNRQTSLFWTTSGGDWIDKNSVSYGATPYAQMTYPLGSTSDANFNVTLLVQKYITGEYPNSGFFLKANEIDNTYISFYSSDWSNASQRPMLVINYTNGSVSDTTPPASITALQNITYAQTYINWTWTDPADADLSRVMVYLGGAFQTNISKGMRYYNATGLTQGTSYTISTKTVDTSGNINSTWVNHTASTSIPPDTTPPASITALQNITYAQTYINWTWADPTDADFSKVMIYFNSIFQTNVTKGDKHYNATGLSSNTSYTISTHTVDASGNINMTWVNHTARTAALTNSTPSIISFSPNTTTPSQYVNTTNTFNVTVDQQVTSKWFLDSIKQSNTSQTYTKTWSYTDAGTHNITYSGENANGTVSKTWIVTVNNVADTTPPVITGVSSSSVPISGATIIWITNEPATSQIEYGLSTGYGSNTTMNSTLTTSHSVTLTGLTSSTIYHYRVKSKDADNNLAVSSDYSFTTLTISTGTAGIWHLDEGSGSIAGDSSGNNNNGTIYGAAWTAGKLGSALIFDGKDNVSIPNSASLNPASEITIEVWFKPASIPQAGWNKIIAKPYTSYASPWQQYALALVNDKLYFELNAGGAKSEVASAVSLANNTWYHVAGTYNGTEMRIYVNGELNGTMSKSGVIASYPTNVHIGAGIYSDKSAEYINGTIDEVKILSRALSVEEVKTDYEAGTPSNPAPSITSFSPDNPTPGYALNSTTPFSVTTDQQGNSTWYLNGANQNNNTQAWSHTWDTLGQYNVTYMGANGNGSVSIMWNVSVVTFSPYDVNRDGYVNEADLEVIRSHFGQITYAPYPPYDVVRYGIVDVYDIAVVSNNILE